MFDAARAALFAVDPGLVEAKTHATIIRRFGQHVVSPGWVDRELGRQLNETEELRLTADYESDPIDIANVQAVVDGMETFVAAVRTFLSSKSP